MQFKNDFKILLCFKVQQFIHSVEKASIATPKFLSVCNTVLLGLHSPICSLSLYLYILLCVLLYLDTMFEVVRTPVSSLSPILSLFSWLFSGGSGLLSPLPMPGWAYLKLSSQYVLKGIASSYIKISLGWNFNTFKCCSMREYPPLSELSISPSSTSWVHFSGNYSALPCLITSWCYDGCLPCNRSLNNLLWLYDIVLFSRNLLMLPQTRVTAFMRHFPLFACNISSFIAVFKHYGRASYTNPFKP